MSDERVENESGQPARRVFHPDLVPPAAQETPPASEAEVEEAPANPEPEVQKVFVGGRERTLDEVVKGYEGSTAEAQRLSAQLEAERRVREAYEQAIARMQQAQTPPAPDPVSEQFENAGVNPQLVEQLVGRKVQEQLGKALEPWAKMAEAQQKLKQADHDFDPMRVQEYLETDPEAQAAYNILVNQDPKLALTQAWKQAKGNSTARSAVDPVAQTAATAPPKRQAPARNEPQEREKRLESLRQEAQETGLWEKYYAERLRGTSADRTADFNRVPTVGRR